MIHQREGSPCLTSAAISHADLVQVTVPTRSPACVRPLSGAITSRPSRQVNPPWPWTARLSHTPPVSNRPASVRRPTASTTRCPVPGTFTSSRPVTRCSQRHTRRSASTWTTASPPGFQAAWPRRVRSPVRSSLTRTRVLSPWDTSSAQRWSTLPHGPSVQVMERTSRRERGPVRARASSSRPWTRSAVSGESTVPRWTRITRSRPASPRTAPDFHFGSRSLPSSPRTRWKSGWSISISIARRPPVARSQAE